MVRWKRALNSTLAVTAVIFASKLFGFVREIIAAGYFGTSMEQGAFLLLPIGAICIVLAQNIIRAAYMRGAFDEHSLLVTSGVFQYYAIGLIAFGLRDILVRAFQAMQDNLTPLRVSCASMATNIALNPVSYTHLTLPTT